MPTCIYCREEKDKTGFRRREHVLPDAFGRFIGALTLKNIVCDACNTEFSKTLDLYLARDTPIGLARYLLGSKSTAEYKSLGRRATMKHQLAEGRLAGATVLINPSVDGPLGTKPLPQIGFGKSIDGPFRWVLCEALPSGKEQIRALIESGYRSVEFVEVLDVPQILEILRGLGLQIGNPRQTDPAGNRGLQRFGSGAVLTQTFGRAIAKIGMNYLASQHGPAVAKMEAFDEVRKYIRCAKPMPRGTWWSEPSAPRVRRRLHGLALFWDSDHRRLVAEVCFFGIYRYHVVLAEGGILMNPPFGPRGHRYNLTTMTVEVLPTSALPR